MNTSQPIIATFTQPLHLMDKAMTEVIELNTSVTALRKHHPELACAVPNTTYSAKSKGRIQVVYMFAGDVLSTEASWGLLPFRSSFTTKPVYYADMDSITHKHSFKRAFRSRRCVIPATSFSYVRQHDDIAMRYTLRPLDEEIFLMCGICELNVSLASMSGLPTAAVITTPSNSMMCAYAQQMPLFLPKDQVMTWLRPGSGFETVKQLIRPADRDSLSLTISATPVELVTSSLDWVTANLKLA